jgi:predicted RNA binding protein YcfA (HicA-like mRNA interferase family)
MPELPTQLPWRRFVCVLRKLGYTAQKTKQGSIRSFMNPRRIPNVVAFREPHPGQNLRPPMLRVSLRTLLLSAEEFTHLLEDC